MSFDGSAIQGSADDHTTNTAAVFAIAPPDAAHKGDTLVRNNKGVWRCGIVQGCRREGLVLSLKRNKR